MTTEQHWTSSSVGDFHFAIALDFIDQIETRMETSEINQAEIARRLGVTEGRVSQIMNNPGNLTIGMMVKCARAAGLKVSVIAYDDNDPDNINGPIHSEIFRNTWELCGKPRDVWSLPSTCAPRPPDLLA